MTRVSAQEPGICLPGDSAYEDATQVFNLAAPARPAVAVTAETSDQVKAAVRYAVSEQLPVRMHATGHGAAGVRPMEGSLLIRTRLGGGVDVDADTRIARVPAGTCWGEVIAASAPYGLAAPHGSSPLVGVVGYLLRGGLSFYARSIGLAANSVRAIELVTADAELRRVDAEHDRELFWALRGGGGGFGVVTAIEFALLPVTEVITGAAYWPGENAGALLSAWLRWAGNAPREVTTTLRIMNLPDHPAVPPVLRGRPVVCVDGAVLGSDRAQYQAAELLDPLRSIAAPLLDTWRPDTAAAVADTHLDPTEPFPVYGDHLLLGDLGDEGAEQLLRVAAASAPLTNIELRQLGGAIAEPHSFGGALDHLDAAYAYLGGGVPFDGITAESIVESCAVVRAALTPWDTGATAPTFVETFEQPQGHLSAQDAQHAAWIRERVDPEGLFGADVVRSTERNR